MNFTRLQSSIICSMSKIELTNYRISLLALKEEVLKDLKLTHNLSLIDEEQKRIEMELMWRYKESDEDTA